MRQFTNAPMRQFKNITSIKLPTMWIEQDNQLKAVFKFKDFAEAFAFMTEVAFRAEKMNHHPDWRNVWNTVEFALSTHDAGNTVTDKDRKLAEAIDEIYGKYA
jgi:4a-hydroxytetrahydrobiopterin dehydratase